MSVVSAAACAASEAMEGRRGWVAVVAASLHEDSVDIPSQASALVAEGAAVL